MHFWKVPRLGSYMAIPLIYKSCLSEQALDAAITDWAEVSKRIEVQDKEKAAFNEEQAQLKQEKQLAGEEFRAEKRDWETIKAAPYMTTEQKFVVSIDTLGQDNDLSDDQKRTALETVLKFKETWEQFEADQLTKDRDNRMAFSVSDKEWAAENVEKIKEEEDKFVEEKMGEIEEGQEPVDDDHKALMQSKYRLEFQAFIFKEREEWTQRLTDLKDFQVIKYGRFVQALLYFLGY